MTEKVYLPVATKTSTTGTKGGNRVWIDPVREILRRSDAGEEFTTVQQEVLARLRREWGMA